MTSNYIKNIENKTLHLVGIIPVEQIAKMLTTPPSCQTRAHTITYRPCAQRDDHTLTLRITMYNILNNSDCSYNYK